MPGLTKKNIIIVDDTKEHLVAITRIVEKAGYLARPVTNAYDAIRACERRIPDVLLVDVTMPEVSGLELCKRLKEEPELKRVPLLFITANRSVTYKEIAYELGAVDYLVKPVNEIELTRKLHLHIEMQEWGAEGNDVKSRLEEVRKEQAKKKQFEQKQMVEFFRKLTYVNPYPEEWIALIRKYTQEFLEHLSVLRQYSAVIEPAFIDQLVTVAPFFVGKEKEELDVRLWRQQFPENVYFQRMESILQARFGTESLAGKIIAIISIFFDQYLSGENLEESFKAMEPKEQPMLEESLLRVFLRLNPSQERGLFFSTETSEIGIE